MPIDDPEASLSAVWVGHATVLLRLGRRYVLTDPNLGGALLVVPRVMPASLRPSELPFVDAVVLSYMHFDHFDASMVRKLGPRPAVFFPRGGERYAPAMFQEIGRRFPGIELAFIPIAPGRGEDGKKDRWGHVGPKGALDISRDVGARYLVPIHFEAYFGDGRCLDEPRHKLT